MGFPSYESVPCRNETKDGRYFLCAMARADGFMSICSKGQELSHSLLPSTPEIQPVWTYWDHRDFINKITMTRNITYLLLGNLVWGDPLRHSGSKRSHAGLQLLGGSSLLDRDLPQGHNSQQGLNTEWLPWHQPVQHFSPEKHIPIPHLVLCQVLSSPDPSPNGCGKCLALPRIDSVSLHWRTWLKKTAEIVTGLRIRFLFTLRLFNTSLTMERVINHIDIHWSAPWHDVNIMKS